MASSLFPSQPAPANNMMGRLGQIRQFAGFLRGRGDPKQLVMAYMQQNGIGQDQLNAAMQQAQEIARMMGG